MKITGRRNVDFVFTTAGRIVAAIAATICLLAGALSIGGAPTDAAFTAAARVATGGSSAFDWAEFHQNSLLTGLAANSSLTASTASQLGVAWATDLYGAALDSPVVAYNSTLDETLAYIGTERGDVVAVDLATGRIVWSVWLGSPIRATPLVTNGAVFAATFNSAHLYKLDASTGALDCSVAAPQPIEGTPVEATPPGGVASIYVGTNDYATVSGPMLAVNAGNCVIEWQFTAYNQRAGSWTAAAYSLDSTGEPLIVFGTSDPDSSVYAVDAVTGVEVWRFQAANPSPGQYDIGAGVDISPPGANGFADGVAYVPSKLGIMYALDLTTGLPIWSTNFNAIAGVTEGGRSTAALDGNNLVFGYNGGLFDLNALTGAVIWSYRDPAHTEVLSSPAIAGPSGSEIVVAGDLGGGVDVLSLATGVQLYHYQTGGYITASPAVSAGNVLLASTDGFLYDLAVGGGNDTVLPSTVITAPVNSSTLPNPNGNQTVTGTASDATAVSAVYVAVQMSGANGPWWNATSGTWNSGPVSNVATLGSSGATSTSWTFAYPVPVGGGTFEVSGYAVSSSGQSDIKSAHSGFAVSHATKGARITATPIFVAPGAKATVTGAGFASLEHVAISLLGTTLAMVNANSKGNITNTAVTIPWTSAFGQTSLVATGASSGRSTSAAITIANTWPQLGNTTTHTNFEPNDPVLFNLISPRGNIFVDLAWKYQTGAAVNASPAVVDGVLYAANTTGQLTAIDTHNGSPLWTWNLPSAQPIDGSPAVDRTKGLVFVGANDGTLDALSMSTGLLVWSAAIGGLVSAPVLGQGELYATTSAGVVTAVSESTGAALWSTTLPSTIAAAPALDTNASRLVVGEANGTVIALSSVDGTIQWSYATSGAVVASPTVSGGTVFVGSSDHNVYALAESTGAKLWSYTTGGAVTDTGSLTNQITPGGTLELIIGSGDGNLYALQASTGALNYRIAYGSPIVGVASVRGVAVIDTASGLVGAARTYTDLDIWKYRTSAAIISAPIVVDGAIYVGAGDGSVYAFTSYGQPPA